MHGRRRNDLPEVVITDVPCNLFDEIDLADAVRSPRGNTNDDGVGSLSDDKAKWRQHVAQTLRVERHAEHATNLARSQRDGSRLPDQVRRPHVAHRVVDDQVGTRERQQFCKSTHGLLCAVGVDASFEAQRGLGAQAQSARTPCDRGGIEMSDLYSDLRRVRANLGRLTSHDAGDPDGHVVAVTDQQIVVDQLALDAVQGDETLSVARRAHDESRRHARCVVGVVRLIQLQVDEVRHVDDVVDRSHPGMREALGDPVGRIADDDPRHHGDGEPRTRVRGMHLDREAACRATSNSRRCTFAERNLHP